MRIWAKMLAVDLATGYILFFYSERVFWSFLLPDDKLRDLVLGCFESLLLGARQAISCGRKRGGILPKEGNQLERVW